MNLPTLADGRCWLDRLQLIFSAMDAAYAQVAESAGFHCIGCEDNCCETLFHHHTLLEYLYLKEGLATLDAEGHRRIGALAEQVCRHVADAEKAGAIPRAMCPLNLDGRCIVYDYRPMICRMHGVAHRLRRPDGRVVRGPGCAQFSRCGGERQGAALDRTPFYGEVAALEGELRRTVGFQGRIRMTVAEMVKRICVPKPSRGTPVVEGGGHANP